MGMEREKWKIFFYFTGLCWDWITSGFTSTRCADSVTELSDYWHAHSSLELRLKEFRGPLRATKKWEINWAPSGLLCCCAVIIECILMISLFIIVIYISTVSLHNSWSFLVDRKNVCKTSRQAGTQEQRDKNVVYNTRLFFSSDRTSLLTPQCDSNSHDFLCVFQ